MVSVNWSNPGRPSRIAVARILSIVSRNLGWRSVRMTTTVRHIPFEMLAKADDHTLDDIGLTRADLETLIRAAAAARAKSRNRLRGGTPLGESSDPARNMPTMSVSRDQKMLKGDPA